jgi:hypothetical protein
VAFSCRPYTPPSSWSRIGSRWLAAVVGAETAPALYVLEDYPYDTLAAALAVSAQRRSRGCLSKPVDVWHEESETVTRQHASCRSELFTPLRVSGAPPAKALTPARITHGTFTRTGKQFKLIDTWTSRKDAHKDLGEAWTGTITFLKRCEHRGQMKARPDVSALGRNRRGQPTRRD